VSQRICVAPPWNIPEVPGDSILILIEPGRAFGTGQHPSTALCLEFLDDIARDQGGLSGSFLDIGCGSGILCIAAQKLGAKTIIGIDIDQDAAGDALKNFTYNRVNNQIGLVNGPLECVRRSFDLVCANLDLGLLKQSIHLIEERVENQGGVILSGILEEEALGISQLYQAAGFYTEGEKVNGEWKALYMRRKGKGEEKKDMRRWLH
jgi:ribosomal protein L11 methyltransferase